MIQLDIHRDGRSVQRLRLDDGVHGIGRHDSNAIKLDDVEVSRRHARLLVDGATVVVEDLGSNNGTLVDGREVSRTVVAAGVTFEVTPFTLVWSDPAASAPALVVEEGQDAGTRFPLLDEALSIGRGDDQDITLDDQGASRSHAILVQQGGRWMIRDSGSANGLFLDGREARDGVLRPGMRVQIGNSVLRFEDPTADESAAFEDDGEVETEVYTQGSLAETALEMPAAPTEMEPAPIAAAAPVAESTGNVGVVALVGAVMFVVLFLVGMLAMVGQAG